jgi:hypothetical protein
MAELIRLLQNNDDPTHYLAQPFSLKTLGARVAGRFHLLRGSKLGRSFGSVARAEAAEAVFNTSFIDETYASQRQLKPLPAFRASPAVTVERLG